MLLSLLTENEGRGLGDAGDAISRRSRRSPTRSWKAAMMTIITTMSIEE